MLVLSRKHNESVMIGDEIEICVVDIRGDKVRLGINAPLAVPVHRLEVYQAIRREALRAGLDPKQAVREGMRGPSQAAAVLDESADRPTEENPDAQ